MLEIEANTYDGAPLAQKLAAQFDQKGGTVGRSDDNRLILPDPQKHVSRVHVEVVYSDEGYHLVRLGANAVYVNQVEVSQGARRLLHDGDAIVIGSYALSARIRDMPSPILTTPRPMAVAPPPQAAAPLAQADAASDDPMGLDELFGPAGGKASGHAAVGPLGADVAAGVAPVDVPAFVSESTPFDWDSPPSLAVPAPASAPGAAAPASRTAARPVASPGAAQVTPGSSIDDIWSDLSGEAELDPQHGDAFQDLPAAAAGAAPKSAPAARLPAMDDAILPGFGSNPFDMAEGAETARGTTDASDIDWGVAPLASPSMDTPAPAAAPANRGAASPAGLDLDELLGPLASESKPAPAPQVQAEGPAEFPAEIPAEFPAVSQGKPRGESQDERQGESHAEMQAETQAVIHADTQPDIYVDTQAHIHAEVQDDIQPEVRAPLTASFATTAPAGEAPAPREAAPAPRTHMSIRSEAAETAAPHDPGVLMQALARGLGLAPRQLPAEFSPEFALLLGKLLRESIGGTLELVNARASARKEIRADVTMLSPKRPNNPMKYAPTPEVALARLLNPQESGFMPGVAALHEVFHDIRSHHMAFMAGMQATLTSVLNRLHPEKVEQSLGEPKAVDSMLPQGRRAKAWLAYLEQYQAVASEMGNEFNTRLGKEFLQAYEAQVARAKSQGPDAQHGASS